ERLGREILGLIENPSRADELHEIFSQIHEDLRRDASQLAADTVLEMVGRDTEDGS
ncbi:MAG: hypothetical protein GQ538_13160, partial [Xanthomonadales bacterium]|nr:hypothetical protein [Xanthomonadales bacterium]